MAIQREIRHQPFQLGIFLSQLPELAQFAQPEPRVLTLPHVERLLADAHRAIDFSNRRSTPGLAQGGQNLLLRMSSSSCPRRSSFRMKKTTPPTFSSSSRWPSFLVLGQVQLLQVSRLVDL